MERRSLYSLTADMRVRHFSLMECFSSTSELPRCPVSLSSYLLHASLWYHIVIELYLYVGGKIILKRILEKLRMKLNWVQWRAFVMNEHLGYIMRVQSLFTSWAHIEFLIKTLHHETINNRSNHCICVSYVSQPVRRVPLMEFESPLENNYTQFTSKKLSWILNKSFSLTLHCDKLR